VLANLLPGLRNLRAPMSAGYLWLATSWFLLVPILPRSEKEATGAIADVYGLVLQRHLAFRAGPPAR